MSKKGISKEFKIGIIVIVSAGLLIWGLSFLKGINFFDSQREYFSVYDEIDGLSVGNPVIYNGYQIGQVRKISFTPDGSGKLAVAYSISEENIHIPVDTKAKIYSSDFFGSKAIEIIMGDEVAMAESGEQLEGVRQEEFTQALRKELEPLKQRTEELIKGVDEIVSNFQQVFDAEATKGLPKAFSSLENTLHNLELTSLRLDSMVAENKQSIGTIFSNVESISSNFRENNEKLNTIFANFESISDSLAQVNFTQTISKADRAMASFEEAMAKVNNGEGSLGKLINNDSLHNQLMVAAQELEVLLDDIESNPRRYLNFSVFGGKDKSRLNDRELETIRQEARDAAREELNQEND